MKNLLIIGIFLIAVAQLATLCFGRRKKIQCLKRFLTSCAVLALLLWFPPVFPKKAPTPEPSPARQVMAMSGRTKSLEDEGFPERAGSDGQVVYYNQTDPRWAFGFNTRYRLRADSTGDDSQQLYRQENESGGNVPVGI